MGAMVGIHPRDVGAGDSNQAACACSFTGNGRDYRSVELDGVVCRRCHKGRVDSLSEVWRAFSRAPEMGNRFVAQSLVATLSQLSFAAEAAEQAAAADAEHGPTGHAEVRIAQVFAFTAGYDEHERSS